VTRDMLTVAWKEWRELVLLGGSVRGGRISLAILLGTFGVFLPYQAGAEWVTSPATLFYWAWLPLMLVAGAVADSFAGERERHTLETLLASRLPDRAILFGKILAAIVYGWGIVMAMLLLSLVTVNATVRADHVLLFSWRFAVAAPVLAWLGAGLVATAGVVVSLRAATVRQASQALSVGILLLIFLPLIGARALPDDWKGPAEAWLMGVGADGVLWTAAAALALLDLLLAAVAMVRFQRRRLIVD
jgi:ABC-2 type transport system permease protein